MKKPVSTKFVTEETGITSKTLKRYADDGLIPKPIFKSFGKKGASNYWPASILYDLVLIKNLKKIGKSMSEIKSIMKGNENAVKCSTSDR